MNAFREAVEFDKQGRYGEAADRFALSNAADPTADGHFARAVALGKAERLEEALPEYDAALAMNPKRQPARLNRASALLKVGRFDEASAEYSRWLEAAPADDPDRRAVQNKIDWIAAQKRDAEKDAPK